MIAIYNKTDGVIRNFIECPAEEIHLQYNPTTETYMQCDRAFGTHVINGEIQNIERVRDTRRPIRETRDRLLGTVDIVYCNAEQWSGMTITQRAAWSTYKQALRDLPSKYNLDNVIWPVPPVSDACLIP